MIFCIIHYSEETTYNLSFHKLDHAGEKREFVVIYRLIQQISIIVEGAQ